MSRNAFTADLAVDTFRVWLVWVKEPNTKHENGLLKEFQCHSMRFFTHDTLQEVSPMRNTKHQLRFYYIFIKSPLSYELVSLTDPGFKWKK